MKHKNIKHTLKQIEGVNYGTLSNVCRVIIIIASNNICTFFAHIYSTIEQQQYRLNKKAVLPQGNRAMPQVFLSVEVRQQHSLQA